MPAYLTFVSSRTDERPHSVVVFTDEDATAISIDENDDSMDQSEVLQGLLNIRMSDRAVQRLVKESDDHAKRLAELSLYNSPYISSNTVEFETEEDAVREAYTLYGMAHDQ